MTLLILILNNSTNPTCFISPTTVLGKTSKFHNSCPSQRTSLEETLLVTFLLIPPTVGAKVSNPPPLKPFPGTFA